MYRTTNGGSKPYVPSSEAWPNKWAENGHCTAKNGQWLYFFSSKREKWSKSARFAHFVAKKKMKSGQRIVNKLLTNSGKNGQNEAFWGYFGCFVNNLFINRGLVAICPLFFFNSFKNKIFNIYINKRKMWVFGHRHFHPKNPQ